MLFSLLDRLARDAGSAVVVRLVFVALSRLAAAIENVADDLRREADERHQLGVVEAGWADDSERA